MRALVQRVSRASVQVERHTVGSIGSGLLILLGVHHDDTEQQARYVAEKCANLRIFADEQGKFNRSALDTGKEVLVVSQFTLYADTSKGRRPSFTEAADPAHSETLYNSFIHYIRQTGLKVGTGVFGAMMEVELVNDGPVTVTVEQ